jgi:hypothetical protein
MSKTTTDTASETSLLPPQTAVRIAWAITGKFSDDEGSRIRAEAAEDDLKHIEDTARLLDPVGREAKYVTSASATIKASLRSLETAYKGRDLNFHENEQTREAYLKTVEESISFGERAKDVLKSLPTMTIGAAGGVTLAKALDLSDINLWILGIGLAALGYVINFIFVRWARHNTMMLYVHQDYERGLYYRQYVGRVKSILRGLYRDVEHIHERVFRSRYDPDSSDYKPEKVIDSILVGVNTTFCPYVHKHIEERKVKPHIWPRCESGDPAAIYNCPVWKGKPPDDLEPPDDFEPPDEETGRGRHG